MIFTTLSLTSTVHFWTFYAAEHFDIVIICTVTTVMLTRIVGSAVPSYVTFTFSVLVLLSLE